jgi:transketolase C-terminal domain/subunit
MLSPSLGAGWLGWAGKSGLRYASAQDPRRWLTADLSVPRRTQASHTAVLCRRDERIRSASLSRSRNRTWALPIRWREIVRYTSPSTSVSASELVDVVAHFSHSGVDDMADNTCHFGINSMFADGGLKPGHGEDLTRLYFPADQFQFAACVKRIFNDPGLRFLFSTRAPVPDLLGEDGKPFYQGSVFEPGKDDLLRKPGANGGYVVAYGEAVYRALDAVIGLKEKGVDAGLINKSTLNVVDESMMRILAKAPWVLVVEGWNVKTGLGSRFGDYLLRAGFKGKYDHLGTHLEGSGGLWQQMGYQGLDPAGISAAISNLSSAA